MGNLLTLSYWFSRTAPKFDGFELQLIMGLVIGLIVVGVTFKIIMILSQGGPWKKLWRRLGNLFMTTGVLVGLSLFFTQTLTPLLGARWWFLLWLVIALLWFCVIVRYGVWKLPKALKADEEHKEFAKYLPKKS